MDESRARPDFPSVMTEIAAATRLVIAALVGPAVGLAVAIGASLAFA